MIYLVGLFLVVAAYLIGRDVLFVIQQWEDHESD